MRRGSVANRENGNDSGIVVDSGTEVPVVRERNLLTAPATLTNIPLLNNRLLLRVYDISGAPAQFRVLLAKDAAVRVEVTPMTPGSRYWAFVSATNNTTNHVTLVTPQ